jgi:hypothetical protein
MDLLFERRREKWASDWPSKRQKELNKVSADVTIQIAVEVLVRWLSALISRGRRALTDHGEEAKRFF